MAGFQRWITERFAERPWWMNALMVFSAFEAFVYIPWDFFFKPIPVDEEAWFGLLLRGPAAKLTEPFHWAIYAAAAYGFWRMRTWMWPWAALYAASVTFGAFLWPLVYVGGARAMVLSIASAIPLALITRALWQSQDLFDPKRLQLRERYGEWALITGASAGLGAAFAHALAREGMSIVAVARRADRLRTLAQELEREHGVATRVVEADLASREGVDAVASAVTDLEIGLLVNNAGAGYAGAFAGQDAERLQAMVALNCTAPMLLTHRLLPGMLERGCGGIVIVGSIAGRQPVPLHAVYSATKGFDILLAESLWSELQGRGVDVVSLQPGPVATEFEEVAGERRPSAAMDEDPDECVAVALEALGKSPSVVSGTWTNWARANASRFLPRALIASVAHDFMARQTPVEMR
jgi:uncharacterized protein